MHIRSQNNLHQTVVNKVLKALEGRNEIKVVKSIKVRLRYLVVRAAARSPPADAYRSDSSPLASCTCSST